MERIKEYLPFAVFATGMATEAYFLPWLFVAQIIIWAFVYLRANDKSEMDADNPPHSAEYIYNRWNR